jgi:hypothetical protein
MKKLLAIIVLGLCYIIPLQAKDNHKNIVKVRWCQAGKGLQYASPMNAERLEFCKHKQFSNGEVMNLPIMTKKVKEVYKGKWKNNYYPLCYKINARTLFAESVYGRCAIGGAILLNYDGKNYFYVGKKTEPLPKAITVAKKPTEKKSFEAYVGITQLTHVTKVKAQSREDALNAGILHCRKLYKNDANDCFVLKLFADNKLSETHNRSPSLIKFNREVKKIKTFDLQYKISDKPLIASLHFERRRIIAKNPKIASPKVSNKTSVKTKTIKTTYKNTSLFDLSYDPLINIELLGDKFYEGTAIRVPENMKKIYGKGCNAMKCMEEAAAREMSRRFKRNEQYNSRYPGNIFFAMAYFELFYENKFYDNQKFLKKVKKEYPNQSYSDGIKIYNLIKLNRVRSKLRNTLGMTLLTPNIEAVNTFWAMGEYLEKNKSSKKIDKNLSKDLKKRLDILEKYREVSRSIQKKIDEEKEDEMKKLLANKKNFFN